MPTTGRLEGAARLDGVAPAVRRGMGGALLCAGPGAYFGLSAAYACLNSANYASAPPQFIRFVLAPGLLSALFIACAIVLPRRAKLVVGLNASALLFALFAFEIFMLFRVIPVQFENLGRVAGENRTVLEREGVLPGFALKGMNRIIGTQKLSEAVLGGLPMQPTLLCARNGAPVSYTSDRFGFNNPDEIYDEGVDLVVLGDSFIEGVCLPPGQDVVGKLRAFRPGAVGIATRGNGPLLELAALHRYVGQLQPKQVVLAFFEGNDWRNFGIELKTPWLRPALDEDVDFGGPTAPEATLGKVRQVVEQRARREITLLETLRRTPVLRNAAALHSTATALGLAYSRSPQERPEFAAVLMKANRFAQRNGAKLFLLYIPQADRYLGLLPHEFVMDQLRNKVLAATERAGVEVIDLAPIFRGDGRAIRFYEADGHFSAEGAALTAQVLAERLGPGRMAAQ